MKKIIILMAVFFGFCNAQETSVIDTTWQKEALGSLSFSQANFDNWANGGENTLAYQADLNGKIIHNRSKSVWSNTGKIAYGNSKIGDAESKKTIDEIRVESILTYMLGFAADPYFLVRGETQLTPGYNYESDAKTQVSGFLDPGYFIQSVGMTYAPLEELSVRAGLALKETITQDFPTPYADDPATNDIEKIKIEPGLETAFTLSKKLGEKTVFNSSLEFFNSFTRFDATDTRWDLDLTTQLAKYINLKFNAKLFYDKDISLKRQLNQSLLVGISYTFI